MNNQKALLHFALISIVAVFSYQTYLLAQTWHFSLEYKMFGTITILTLIYYNYKISEKIYDYQRRKTRKPYENIIKEFYDERTPKIIEEPVKSTPEVKLEPPNKEIDIKINLDTDKGLFYGKDLNIAEKEYILNHHYKTGNFVPIGKTRQEECYIKPNNIESLEHTFLVQNIKQELEKYTKEIQISITEKPDILFKNNSGKIIAIEVETGIHFNKHKNKLDDKFFMVSKQYPKAIIVLTTNRIKHKYLNINNGIPIILRHQIHAFLSTQFKHNGDIIMGQHLGRKNQRNG